MSQASDARLEARALQQVMLKIQPMMRSGNFTREEGEVLKHNQNQLGVRAVLGGMAGGTGGYMIAKAATQPRLRIPAIGVGLLVGSLSGASTYGSQPLINLLSVPNSPVAIAGREAFKEIAPNSGLLRQIEAAVAKNGGSSVDSRASDFDIDESAAVPAQPETVERTAAEKSLPPQEELQHDNQEYVEYDPQYEDKDDPLSLNNGDSRYFEKGVFDQDDDDDDAYENVVTPARSWDEIRRDADLSSNSTTRSNRPNRSNSSASQGVDDDWPPPYGEDGQQQPRQGQPIAPPAVSWAEIRQRAQAQ
jgi:hypothetical protein